MHEPILVQLYWSPIDYQYQVYRHNCRKFSLLMQRHWTYQYYDGDPKTNEERFKTSKTIDYHGGEQAIFRHVTFLRLQPSNWETGRNNLNNLNIS